MNERMSSQVGVEMAQWRRLCVLCPHLCDALQLALTLLSWRLKSTVPAGHYITSFH